MGSSGLIFDPSAPVTLDPPSKIQTDMHNIIRAIMDGTDPTNFAALMQPSITKNVSYTIVQDDFVILVDTNGADRTITLPDASLTGIKRRVYAIKKTNSDNFKVTIDTTSSQTIDGVTTQELKLQHDTILLISDGTNWKILASTLNKDVLEMAKQTSTPSDPPTGSGKFYMKEIDANNVVPAALIEENGSFVEVELF